MHRSLLFAILRRRWLIIALIAGMAMVLAPNPDAEHLSPEGWRVLAIVVIAVVLWMTEAVPLPAVAFLIAGGEVLLVEMDPDDVAKSFMKDSVFFIMGSLMLAVGIVRQRVDRRIAFVLTRITGPRTTWIALGILTASTVIASFVADHTVAAFMLPVALTLVTASGEDAEGQRRLGRLLLLAVAYGSNIGALGSPSGGARNIIMMGFWDDFYAIHLGYGEWIKWAFPVVLLQIPGAFIILWLATRPHPRQLAAAVSALQEQVAEEGRMGTREWAAVGIFAAVLVAWITVGDTVGLGVIAVLGGTLYLLFGLVDWSDYNSGVNWGVVLVYAAAISLGTVMDKTGAADWVARTMLARLSTIGITGGFALLGVFALITLLFTNVMSAAATVAVVGPVLLRMATDTGLNPVIAGFVVALAAAFGYVTTFSHPPNMIVYGSGRLQSRDYIRIGWKVTLMSLAVLFLMAAVYWPHLAVPQPLP